MKIEWTGEKVGTFTHHVALVGDYTLSITGDGTTWIWSIWRQTRTEFSGVEGSVDDAIRATEALMLRVQDGSEGTA